MTYRLFFHTTQGTTVTHTEEIPRLKRLSLVTLSNTLFNLEERILDTILYTHPTKEIGLKSFKSCGFTIFGTRVIKEALVPFVQLPPSAKNCIALKTSPFIISQQNFIKPK